MCLRQNYTIIVFVIAQKAWRRLESEFGKLLQEIHQELEPTVADLRVTVDN